MATGTIKNTVRQMRKTTRQVINASLMMEEQLPANWDISYMMKKYLSYRILSSVYGYLWVSYL